MAITIRKATNADITLIVAGRLWFLVDTRGPGFEPPPGFEDQTRSFVTTEANEGRLHTWIAEDGDEFAGLVSLLLWTRPPLPEDDRTREGYIVNMFVSNSRSGVHADEYG
jgi:hypothetical protein